MYVVVPRDRVDYVVVQLVQPLEEVELLLDLVQLRLLRVRQSEEVLPDGVGGVLAPEGVEVVLEHLQAVGGLAGGQTGLEGEVAVEGENRTKKGEVDFLEDSKVNKSCDEVFQQVFCSCGKSVQHNSLWYFLL